MDCCGEIVDLPHHAAGAEADAPFPACLCADRWYAANSASANSSGRIRADATYSMKARCRDSHLGWTEVGMYPTIGGLAFVDIVLSSRTPSGHLTSPTPMLMPPGPVTIPNNALAVTLPSDESCAGAPTCSRTACPIRSVRGRISRGCPVRRGTSRRWFLRPRHVSTSTALSDSVEGSQANVHQT